MERNEIIVASSKVNELSSSTLKKNINGLLKALETSQSNAWTIASYVNEIFMADNYEDDFETDGELAKWLGISLGLVSQYKGAVSFIVKHNELEKFMSVTRAYLLSVLESNGEYDEFINWLAGEGIDIEKLSDAKMKKAIKSWRATLEEDVAEESEEDVAEEDGAEEDVAEETEIVGVTFEIEGVMYRIPYSVLDQYRVQ